MGVGPCDAAGVLTLSEDTARRLPTARQEEGSPGTRAHPSPRRPASGTVRNKCLLSKCPLAPPSRLLSLAVAAPADQERRAVLYGLALLILTNLRHRGYVYVEHFIFRVTCSGSWGKSLH